MGLHLMNKALSNMILHIMNKALPRMRLLIRTRLSQARNKALSSMSPYYYEHCFVKYDT